MKYIKHLFIIVLIFLLAAVITGCMKKTQEKPPIAPVDSSQRPKPEEAVPAWTTQISGDLREEPYGWGEQSSSHIIVDGQLILRTAGVKAAVTAVALGTGEVLWSHELWRNGLDTAFAPGYDIFSYASWVVYGNTLTLPVIKKADSQLFLEKLDITTGQSIWRASVGTDLALTSMKLLNGILLTQGYTVSAGTGNPVNITSAYSFESGKLLYSLQGKVILREDSLYLIPDYFSADTSAYRFSRYSVAGKKMWETMVNLTLDPGPHFLLWDILDSNGVIVLPLRSKVLALSCDSGKVLWERDYSTAPSVAVHGDQVYLAWPDKLEALKITTADLLWEKPLGGIVSVSHDKVFLTQEERLLALNPATGEPVWELKIKNPRPNRVTHMWDLDKLLHDKGVLWVSSAAESKTDEPHRETLTALEPKTGRTVSVYNYEWWAGGPGSWPLRIIADGEDLFISLSTANMSTKILDAHTGLELWDTEDLSTFVSGDYKQHGVYLNTVYYHNYYNNQAAAEKREFMVLDKKTGEVTRHFTGKGTPLKLLENRLLLAEWGERNTTLYSIVLEN